MTKQSLRDIIEIDEDLCDGCGLCIPNCAEGALVIVDGKAKLVEDARCDGAGACLGHCPQGALRIIERRAEDFDERYAQAQEPAPVEAPSVVPDVIQIGLRAPGGGCPGSRAMQWQAPAAPPPAGTAGSQSSALRQWPVQLHLLSPAAPFLRERELLLCADCVAFAHGGFHAELLDGRSLAVACPKLDDPRGYEEKLAAILSDCDVPALRVAIMEVPCCGGLVRLAERAVSAAGYQGEVEVIVISRFGEILQRQVLAKRGARAAQAGA